MLKKLTTSFAAMNTFLLHLALAVLSLFALGYVAHNFFGDNNLVEEIAEELLEEEFNIEFEFSENNNK